MENQSINKGNPHTSSDSGISDQIRNAAAQVFAESGYGGARMDEMARRAGVNKSAIYYHIGNKSTLYTVVFEEMFTTLLADLERNIIRSRTPQDKLRAHVRTLISHKIRFPHFAPIVMREVASGFHNVSDQMVQRFQYVFRAIAGILEEGAQSGVFREVDPVTYHLMVLGVAAFFSSEERHIGRLEKCIRPEDSHLVMPGTSELIEQFTATILRSLEPDNH
jgi:TetR/AcrR family transcriptional regulator